MIFQIEKQRMNHIDCVARPRRSFAALLKLFVLGCSAVLLAACIDSSGKSTADGNTGNGTQLPTVSLSVTPDQVVSGADVTLTWTATDASSCVASGAWNGTQPLNGTISSSVMASGTYTLTCTGSGGSASASANVRIEAPPAPPLVTLSVSPGSIAYNGAATLTWSSSNAATCAASNAWNGAKDTAGAQTLGALINTGTYTLTCTGAGGSTAQSVTVVVEEPAAPTISLTSSATTIAYNGSATLTWATTNATSCTASGAWSGTKATSGTQTLSTLITTVTYTLICTGAGGSTNKSVTLTVQPAPVPVPVVTFTANSTSVAYNGTATLIWSSSNATLCSASEAWNGTKSTSGTLTLASLTMSGTYTLTCTGNGGSTSASVTITVLAAPPEAKINIPGSAVSASTYDDRCACLPANTVDTDITTRWSGFGDGVHITFDLGSPYKVEYAKIAWYKGNERTALFDVLAADTNAGPWTSVLTGKTSGGITNELETFDFPDIKARYIRVVGHGSSVGDFWSSILEVQVFGTAIAQVTTPQFDPPSGVYPDGTTVSIVSATSGAEVRYTMDGTTPTSTNGFVYSAPVPITVTTTLKAIATKSGIADSTSASATYTIASGGGGSRLDPAVPPSGNFDLAQWKLTIPSGADISVLTLNSGYTLTDAFYTDPVTGGMVFRTPNIAGTTSGSTYSRSELREMLNESAGTTNLGNNWVLGTSSASAKAAAARVDGSMKVTLSVDHVSTTGDSAKLGRVVVGQIHGPDTEVIRLYFHKRPSDSKGAIYFGHDSPSNSNTYYPLIGDPDNLNPADGIALGERWSYEIKVVGQTLIVTVTPEVRPAVTKTLAIESGYNDLYLYYKVGVYNQNNTGDSSDYVQATVFSLIHGLP